MLKTVTRIVESKRAARFFWLGVGLGPIWLGWLAIFAAGGEPTIVKVALSCVLSASAGLLLAEVMRFVFVRPSTTLRNSAAPASHLPPGVSVQLSRITFAERFRMSLRILLGSPLRVLTSAVTSLLILLPLALATLASPLDGSPTSLLLFILTGTAALIVVMAAWIAAISHAVARTHGRQVLNFTSRGIEIGEEGGRRALLPWIEVNRVKETHQFIYISRNRRLAHAFPKRFLTSPEELNALREIIFKAKGSDADLLIRPGDRSNVC